jgi:hypothetical protein
MKLSLNWHLELAIKNIQLLIGQDGLEAVKYLTEAKAKLQGASHDLNNLVMHLLGDVSPAGRLCCSC